MKDNFSKQADVYAKYRPGYPPELFDFILQYVTGRETAWDCATGNGQSAKELTPHFKKIFATDISQKQLDKAYQLPNIIYSLQPAEKTNFEDSSIDLVTVAQALHWFRFDEFYTETNRVLKPSGWIAAWTYSLLRISPGIDAIIDKYHFETMESYWDNERKYVDNHYTTIPFPFDEIRSPVFSSNYEWTIEELEGYFNTWSALQKFIAVNNYSPVGELMKEIKPHWENERMNVKFPIYLRMGRTLRLRSGL